jgi:vacuolar-type H+-ATPase subunit F/Vma7
MVLIGDEFTAAGWRLAGVHALIPDPREVGVALRTALQEADIVLITAELASRVATAELTGALLGSKPLVVVIPDVRARQKPPDIEGEVRAILGVGA